MGVRAGWEARERAAAMDAAATRRIRASVRAGTALGDALAEALWRARGDGLLIDQTLAAWAADLADAIATGSVRSHLQAHADAIAEASAVLARRPVVHGQRLFAADDPTARAVGFLRARLGVSPEQTEALRGVYGRAALDITLPMKQKASPAIHATMADVVGRNLNRRDAQREILAALQGVTGASPAIAETIFRTQHQMAYSAGAWQADQDPAIAEIVWGYQYVTVGDDRVRPRHIALDGTQLPKDDPRWAEIRPPNGYNCRCQIVRIFDTDDHTETPPGSVEIDGEGVKGGADPGFGFNPGVVYQDVLRIERAAEIAAVDARRIARQERKAKAAGFPETLPAGLPAAPVTPDPTKPPAPDPTPVDERGFPIAPGDIGGLAKDEGAAGGSTGARIVTINGRRFVLKRGSSPDHLREESAALAAYRAAGVPVPETRLYETESGPVLLSKWEEGQSLASLSPAEQTMAFARISDHFAVDSLLGNWDVAGMGLDNIIVRPDGTPVRIDVGGSLRYRAQGKPKGEAFGDHPNELWTLRDAAKNRQSAQVFERVTWDRIVGQIDGIDARRAGDVLEAVPAGPIRDRLAARLGEMKELADVSRPMLADAFRPAHVDRVAFHTNGLRARGFHTAMVESLRPVSKTAEGAVLDLGTPAGNQDWNGSLADATGKDWDNLRGVGGKSATGILLEQARQQQLGEAITNYHQGQRSNSWNTEPRLLKLAIADARTVPEGEYFLNNANPYTASQARDKYEGAKRQQAELLALLQASSMQTLRRVDMPNNDRAGRRLWLVRTEHSSVIQKQHPGATPGSARLVLQRGAAESFSLARAVSVKGAEVTYQYVPHHRVVTGYWLGEYATFLGGDHENEVVAIGHGIPSVYTGTIGNRGAFLPAPGGVWDAAPAPAPAAPKRKPRVAKPKGGG